MLDVLNNNITIPKHKLTKSDIEFTMTEGSRLLVYLENKIKVTFNQLFKNQSMVDNFKGLSDTLPDHVFTGSFKVEATQYGNSLCLTPGTDKAHISYIGVLEGETVYGNLKLETEELRTLEDLTSIVISLINHY